MKTLPENLFWDVRPETIEIPRHSQFVIERVLGFGRPADIRWVLATFSQEEIGDAVRHSRRLDRRTAGYWGIHLGISREEIACFQNPPHQPFTG